MLTLTPTTLGTSLLAAEKMAAKARPVLEAHRDRLAAYAGAAALFRTLDPAA